MGLRRARRSELATPATSIKMMKKGVLETSADEVFFDLEDSVPVSQKPLARSNVVEVLREGGKPSHKTIAIRINSTDTAFWYDDLRHVIGNVGDKIDCVILPKVRRAEDVQLVDKTLKMLEDENGLDRMIGLEVLIETAEGLLRCGEIAFSSPRLESLIFGPGDYAASIGMLSLAIGGQAEEYPGHIWHYPLYVVRTASAAAGLQAIDGPYAKYTDIEGFKKAATLSRTLGYDGKWVIHPSQIETCNKIYSPTMEELEKARKIIGAYEEAVKSGLGAVSVDGMMVDDATIKIAKRILDMERIIPQPSQSSPT